ncbi:MAG: cupredoxin family copper-binding protein [Xanthobacteraceae bacterium]|nr:cupredoxin family copper-binding protein [Xanthobacteraceae bacterium]
MIPNVRSLAILAVVLGAMGCPAAAETIRVRIDKLVFSPAEVSARVGDTIEWVNDDILAHTATVKGGWDVMIPAKKTVGLVLRTPGDVAYYCRFHPNMTGRIAVAPK